MSNAFRILIIEDSQTDAHVVSEILLKATFNSYTPIVAGNLEQGLKHLRTGSIDAILLDLSLDNTAGLDTFVRVPTFNRASCQECNGVLLRASRAPPWPVSMRNLRPRNKPPQG